MRKIPTLVVALAAIALLGAECDQQPPAGGGGNGSVPSRRPPDPTGSVKVNATIVVKRGQTFDGRMRLHVASKSNLGDGSQKEGQKPVFRLERGARLENVLLEGADGIHCDGDNVLTNVWWVDVGEDALTVRGPNVVVRKGGAWKAEDKVFQMNHEGPLTIEDFHFEDFGRAVRGNGNPEHARTPFRITMKDITARDGTTIVKITSQGARADVTGATYENVQQPWIATGGARIDVNP